jgi:hypothetical protein
MQASAHLRQHLAEALRLPHNHVQVFVQHLSLATLNRNVDLHSTSNQTQPSSSCTVIRSRQPAALEVEGVAS